MEAVMSKLNNEKIVKNMITEGDFAIDNMGRIIIINNKKVLETVSGGIKSSSLDNQFLLDSSREVKSNFLDNQFLLDQLGNNCNCGSGSGSGSN
jgi:hypothetical protein